MEFFNSAIEVLQTLVVALGAGLGVWGAVNLLEGYGNDNPGSKSQGMKQLMAGGGVALVGITLIPLVDMIDLELFTGDDQVKETVAYAHAHDVKVVMSNHDFHKTPEAEEIIARLRKMQSFDADIPKIALMPQSTSDVLTLLAATLEMQEQYADRPIITMSMAKTGVISRLAGEVFGSAATFGAVDRKSVV